MCCPDLNPIPLGSRDKHANHRIPSQLSVSLWWPPQSKWTLGGNGTPKSWCWSKSENSHYRGKDHCMAGFQFNWIAFDQMLIFVGTETTESKPVKLDNGCSVIRAPTIVSVLWVVWPDLAKFCHFGKSLPVFGKFLIVHFLFGKILSWLWRICDIIGLIFIVANGQILKNNPTIWSHWLSMSIW